MSDFNISEEEQERIGKTIGKTIGRILVGLISDKREWDVTACYEGNSPSKASVWHKNAMVVSNLVDDFLTNEDTDKLQKIVIELSPKK